MAICMAPGAPLNKQMEASIMVTLGLENSTGRARSFTQTVEAIPGPGLSASKTVMVCRYLDAGNLYKVNGSKERGSLVLNN